MKKHWRKWALGVVCGASAVLSTPADAGQKTSYEVYISTYNTASGSLGAARASSDQNQHIGCSSYGNTGSCSATDRNGQSVFCSWNTPAAAQAVASMTALSYVWFSYNADYGTCGTIYVANDSASLPPTP